MDDPPVLQQLVKQRRGTNRRKFTDAKQPPNSSASMPQPHVGANAANAPPPDYHLNFIAAIAAWQMDLADLGSAANPTPEMIRQYWEQVRQETTPPHRV